jgi:hypothetical protein
MHGYSAVIKSAIFRDKLQIKSCISYEFVIDEFYDIALVGCLAGKLRLPVDSFQRELFVLPKKLAFDIKN